MMNRRGFIGSGIALADTTHFLDVPAMLASETFPRLTTFSVESTYQNGLREINVLLPDTYSTTKNYCVVYALPAGPGTKPGPGQPLFIFKRVESP
jgi:hypothetical protein